MEEGRLEEITSPLVTCCYSHLGSSTQPASTRTGRLPLLQNTFINRFTPFGFILSVDFSREVSISKTKRKQTLSAMPIVNTQHFRLLKALGRLCSREFRPHSKQHSFSAQPLVGTKAKQELLLSREKTDAQQALLEEAVDSAARLLLGRARKSTAETWALRWDDCLLAS